MSTFDLSASPTAGVPVLRVLDAAANRAAEAVRVIEDYVRFVLDDRHLAGECKHLRHDIAATWQRLQPGDLQAARETQQDVGTKIVTHLEQTRTSAGDVLTANCKRLQQSLRSLEEYSKVIAPEVAAAWERLRYRSYTLEKAIGHRAASVGRLQGVRLYVLIDGRETEAALAELAGRMVEAGAHAIQFRDKRLADRELLRRARILRSLTRGTGTLFILNDRADLAVLCDADGVHVGQDELSVKDARTIVGPQRLVGVSTHSIEQARAAVIDGADYIGVGPTFASTTKEFDVFTGLDLLREVAAEIRLPAFAIGGITLDRLDDVRSAGFDRVAVQGAITSANDPVAAVREFLERLRTSAGEGGL